MGRKFLIDVADGLAFIMQEDRPYTKKEIAKHFSCSEHAASNWAKQARREGHPVRITLRGYWYMGGKNWNMEKLAALAGMQACAGMAAMKLKQLAIECDNEIKHAPKRLLLEYKKQENEAASA